MQKINDCFLKVKKDCFRFISSQGTKKDKAVAYAQQGDQQDDVNSSVQSTAAWDS